MRILSLVLISITSGAVSHGQTHAFDVATVKLNKTGSGNTRRPRLINGRLAAENVSLRQILQAAHGIGVLQITGPGWLDSDRFDLAANAPQGTPDSDLAPMLQSLMKERLALAVHLESKEMAVYILLPGKDGLKISLFDPSTTSVTLPRNGAESMIIGVMTMSQLATQLTPTVGRPVLDQSGLEGRYFCALTFSALSAEPNNDASADKVDVFEAVQPQLGLRLEPRNTRSKFWSWTMLSAFPPKTEHQRTVCPIGSVGVAVAVAQVSVAVGTGTVFRRSRVPC